MASSGKVVFGTCGWSGHGAPWVVNSKSAAQRLSLYARRFAAVEVNTTTYALPDPSVVRRWVAAVPKGSRIAISCPFFI